MADYSFHGNEKTSPTGAISALTHVQMIKSSNGVTPYTISKWSDDELTCNCPGWTIKKKDKMTGEYKPRTCSHIKKITKANFADMIPIEEAIIGSAGTIRRANPVAERQLRAVNIRDRA
jgi:hypothetical protein